MKANAKLMKETKKRICQVEFLRKIFEKSTAIRARYVRGVKPIRMKKNHKEIRVSIIIPPPRVRKCKADRKAG